MTFYHEATENSEDNGLHSPANELDDAAVDHSDDKVGLPRVAI
jgi:hypothetical protein